MIVSLLAALAIQAAAPPVSAPEQRYLRISFNPRQWDATFLRPARPVGPLDAMFKADGAALKAIAALPEARAWARATVAVDADGRVGACTTEAEGPLNVVALAQAICADVKTRGRFLPTLDQAGRRVPATVSIFAMSSDKERLWGLGGDTPPLVDDMPPPPAPPAPPNMWSPFYASGDYAVEGAKLFTGDRAGLIAGRAPWTGVALSLDSEGRTRCAIAQSSKDAAIDARACKAAAKYRLRAVDPARTYRRGAMIMMVANGSSPRALLPVAREGRKARLTTLGAQRLLAAVGKPIDDATLAERVEAAIGVDGAATRCQISTSEGDDVADLQLCGELKANGLLTPAEDVFGLPRASWL